MPVQWFPDFTHMMAQHAQATGSPTRPSPDKSVTRPADEIRSAFSSAPAASPFMRLPAEIHLQIAQQLIYPDALSLKHTNRYFYQWVDTGVELKVDWLMSRRLLHLDCPNDTRCDLGSDLRFCRGSVPLLMKRRREHIECDSRPGIGCLVYGTSTCTHRRPPHFLWRWFRLRLTFEMWWVLLALVPVILSWLWFAELLVLPAPGS
ncbi:F-box domain-containing protein [Niveomyces insectorum RCEF 264]|uniref:F-box domain-containing protein n=1 Tax=Niveomyces insectorum RCEF 264 TaxID=1081102 RepID=A0A167YNP8_9HYPO|nr:F-box domain-containing protein [Niveomyces insectorum RCEF 264]